MKLTKKRQEILSALKKSSEALTAKQLHELLAEVDLVTVYRALDVFVKEGVIKRVLLDGGETFFEYQHEPHHHAVCGDCKRVIHFTIKDEHLKNLLPLKNFSVEDIELTVRGHCSSSSHES